MTKPLAKLRSMLTPKRRWAQFSLATLLAVMTLLCVWLSVMVTGSTWKTSCGIVRVWAA
jgi:hypothetical protein